MNILPKKSWHVRSRDNVERVRRDEERAAAEERESKRRAALADQEARTEFLRKRARLSLPDVPTHEVVPVHQKLNLFSDLEGGKMEKVGSKEYEAERRQEKERRERALGLLTYLGQSASESQTAPPWYTQPPSLQEVTDTDVRLKRRMDPLRGMKEGLRGGASREVGGRTGRVGPATGQSGLRAERLRREEAERARAEALLRGLEGRGRTEEQGDEGRAFAYNSQFHPELTRQHRKRRR
ncbi:leukocyte receptor cluster member 1 [Hypanus sabinus]|uniref:leukocyte receptor cluster member 1 n=1 Tax=Hypanus sabinus TaxID=79690 RepID=UPI0028C510C0|nr:leukocyte receptor cluster member 1 [Hypanus sabinus]